eukprot:1154881-Pelagomonas_calceolata.AAC.4
MSVSGEYSRMSGRVLAMRGRGRPRLLHSAAVSGRVCAKRLTRLHAAAAGAPVYNHHYSIVIILQGMKAWGVATCGSYTVHERGNI